MDNEELLSDVITSVVEKVLMSIGMITYNKVGVILEAHNVRFSECYRRPDVLNFALKEIFGDAYLEIVEKIRRELYNLEDDDKNLARFLEILSE